MKEKKLKHLVLKKIAIAKLSNPKMIKGGTVSLADGNSILYDIHTNPLDTNTNPLPTAQDTNTIIGDTVTEITETAPAATSGDPVGNGTGSGGPPPFNSGGNNTMLC